MERLKFYNVDDQYIEYLYKFVTIDKKKFFIQICCDFKLLEEKCKSYKKEE